MEIQLQLVRLSLWLGGLFSKKSDICITISKKGLIKGIIDNADINDMTDIGYYFIHNNNINSPKENMWFYMEVYNFSGIYILQRATYWTEPTIVYTRTKSDNGWSKWTKV